MNNKTKTEFSKWATAVIAVLIISVASVAVLLGAILLAKHVPYGIILPFVMIACGIAFLVWKFKRDLDNRYEETMRFAYLLLCYMDHLWKVLHYVKPEKSGHYLAKYAGTIDAEVAYYNDVDDTWSCGEPPTWWCELPEMVMGEGDPKLKDVVIDVKGEIEFVR